jgi:hypothetical protein
VAFLVPHATAAPITAPLETPSQIAGYAQKQALAAGIDVKAYIATLACESRFDAHAVGDHGHSLGIAQINMPAWKNEVTPAQAFNPKFAVGWSIEKFKENPRIWTCYRILRG